MSLVLGGCELVTQPPSGSTHPPPRLTPARNRIDKDAAKRFITHSIGAAPANSNAAMARRQAEAAIRERQEGESRATRANRFRHVARDAERLSGGEDEEGERMDVDGDGDEPIADSEEEAAALLAEVDEDIDQLEVPEPAEARVDPPSRPPRRSKRKRAEDLG